MRFFVTRARYNTDLAAAHAETNRVRTQRDNALAERDTAIFNRRQVLDQLADAQAGNRRAEHLQRRLDQYLVLDSPAVLSKGRRQPPAVKETTP